jgi:hypothetical protein
MNASSQGAATEGREGLGFETIDWRRHWRRARRTGSAALSSAADADGDKCRRRPGAVMPGLTRLMDVCGNLVISPRRVFDGECYDPKRPPNAKARQVNRASAQRAILSRGVFFHPQP